MSDTPILRCRFVILISGQGSNMQALVQACQSKACSGEVVSVVSNRAQAGGVLRTDKEVGPGRAGPGRAGRSRAVGIGSDAHATS